MATPSPTKPTKKTAHNQMTPEPGNVGETSAVENDNRTDLEKLEQMTPERRNVGETSAVENDDRTELEKLKDFAKGMGDQDLIDIFERIKKHATRLTFINDFEKGPDHIEQIAQNIPDFISTKDPQRLKTIIELYRDLKPHTKEPDEYHYFGLAISEMLLLEFMHAYKGQLRAQIAEHMLREMIQKMIGDDAPKRIKNYKKQPYLINCVVFSFAYQQLVQARPDTSAFTRTYEQLVECSKSNFEFWEGLIKLFVKFVPDTKEQEKLLTNAKEVVKTAAERNLLTQGTEVNVSITTDESPEVKKYLAHFDAWLKKPEDTKLLDQLFDEGTKLDNKNADVIAVMKMVAREVNRVSGDLKYDEALCLRFFTTVDKQTSSCASLLEEEAMLSNQFQFYELSILMAQEILIKKTDASTWSKALIKFTQFFVSQMKEQSDIWGPVVLAFADMIYDKTLKAEFQANFDELFKPADATPQNTPLADSGLDATSNPLSTGSGVPRKLYFSDMEPFEVVSSDDENTQPEDDQQSLLKKRSIQDEYDLLACGIKLHYDQRSVFLPALEAMKKHYDNCDYQDKDNEEAKLREHLEILNSFIETTDLIYFKNYKRPSDNKTLIAQYSAMISYYDNHASSWAKAAGIALALIAAAVMIAGITCLAMSFSPAIASQLPGAMINGATSLTNLGANALTVAGGTMTGVGLLGLFGGSVIAWKNSETNEVKELKALASYHALPITKA